MDTFILLMLLLIFVLVGRADIRAFNRRLAPMTLPQMQAFLGSRDCQTAMRFGGSLYLDFRDWRHARQEHHKEM